jgi:hypothetical protein
MLYHRFHQKMISNIDKWIDKTIQDIRQEEKLFPKYTSERPLDSNKQRK